MTDDLKADEDESSDRQPSRRKKAFACPHCKAYTQQAWYDAYARPTDKAQSFTNPENIRAIGRQQESDTAGAGKFFFQIADTVERGDPGIQTEWQHESTKWVTNAAYSVCFVCQRETFWIGEKIFYPPPLGTAPEPNPDLPLDIRADYLEAAAVLPQSPRASCALLRLSIQKLCSTVLGRPGDINEMIADLVKKGLPPRIQKALDVVRVIGNEAVHPGHWTFAMTKKQQQVCLCLLTS